MSDTTQLTVPERAAVALGAAEHEKTLLALATKYSDITKIVNPAGREQCHAAYMELKNTRVNIEKAGKDAREDANAFQKAVIEEVKRLTAITAAEEARLQVVRDTYDAEREAERQAKAAADKARVDAIRAKIDEIKDCVVVAMGKTADEISSAIAELESTEITLEEYFEFSGEAQAVQAATVAKLKEALSAQTEIERAAAEAARQAEVDRIERERVAEANRIEAQRLADLAEELERRAQEARDKQAEADRMAREQREAAEAEQRAANERAAEAMRQQQAEHEARMRAQQDEIDRQQAEINRAKAEQERIERERQEAIEAEARAQREAEEAAARAEAERIERERVVAVMEAMRREQEQFAMNGPGDVEIVKCLAHQYDVTVGDVMGWMKKFDYTAVDEQLAAENVAANHLEKAA